MKVFLIKNNSCKELKLPTTAAASTLLTFGAFPYFDYPASKVATGPILSPIVPLEAKIGIGVLTVMVLLLPVFELYMEQDKKKMEKMKKELADYKFFKEYNAMVNEKNGTPTAPTTTDMTTVFEDEDKHEAPKEKIEVKEERPQLKVIRPNKAI